MLEVFVRHPLQGVLGIGIKDLPDLSAPAEKSWMSFKLVEIVLEVVLYFSVVR